MLPVIGSVPGDLGVRVPRCESALDEQLHRLPGNGYVGNLNPGCYNNLNLNGATVTMLPGTYVFNGGTNFNGASITGSGVTMYVTASGTPPNFNGVANR